MEVDLPTRKVPPVHATALQLVGTGSTLMCPVHSYGGGGSKKALKNPADNGGWASVSTAPTALASDAAAEEERLQHMTGVSKATVAAVMNELENLGHRPAAQPAGLVR